MNSAKMRRVLIVDDEIYILKASASILKLHGFRNIVTESDSRRVVAIMNTGEIDVVLLDLFMPHISGIDLLPILRELHPQMPVIIVTAAYESERADECFRLGAFDFIEKPVTPERLIAALLKAFEN